MMKDEEHSMKEREREKLREEMMMVSCSRILINITKSLHVNGIECKIIKSTFLYQIV